MNPNEVMIDRVIAEFGEADYPVRIESNGDIIRRLTFYKPYWETCAEDLAANFRPSRFELIKCLRGRINLDRAMVVQTIARLIEESFENYLVASGESRDLATIVSSALFSVKVEL